MYLDFSLDREVRFKIMNCLKKIVSEFTETIKGRVAAPSVDHLFKVSEDVDRKWLDGYQDTTFHYSVAQLIFDTPHIGKDI